jgi:hypothetical protein
LDEYLRPNVTQLVQRLHDLYTRHCALIATKLLHLTTLDSLQALLDEVDTMSPAEVSGRLNIGSGVIDEVALCGIGDLSSGQ